MHLLKATEKIQNAGERRRKVEELLKPIEEALRRID